MDENLVRFAAMLERRRRKLTVILHLDDGVTQQDILAAPNAPDEIRRRAGGDYELVWNNPGLDHQPMITLEGE